MSSDPTPREHALAAEIDLGLVAIETRGLDGYSHTQANRALIAAKLATYREELAARTARERIERRNARLAALGYEESSERANNARPGLVAFVPGERWHDQMECLHRREHAWRCWSQVQLFLCWLQMQRSGGVQ